MVAARSVGSVAGLFVKPETPGERGLPKAPVPRIEVLPAGVVGDFNRWRTEERHGDPNMAVLLMDTETLAELNRQGWPVRPGDLGENVLVQGVPYAELGSQGPWRIGEAVVEIAKPCDPCDNLSGLPYVGRARAPEFIRTMLGRRGWYGRVITAGTVRVGDPVEPLRTARPLAPP